MKNLKIPAKSAVFLSKSDPNKQLNGTRDLIIGKYENDEFRGLLEFQLNPRVFDFQVSRADLVFYLNSTKIDLNIESFMLNISRNLEDFNPSTVTWNTSPKFFQEANFAKIEPEFANNFIRVDISLLLRYWLKARVSNFAMTLVGLADNSLINLSNISNKKPFLELHFNEGSIFENSHRFINKNIRTSEIYNDDCSCDDFFNYPSKHNSHCDEINQNIDHYTDKHHNFNTMHEKTTLVTKDEKSFGNFISLNGDLIRNSELDYCYVKFDSESTTLRTNLNICHDGVFILSSGIYKVDYFVNCRTEPFTSLELELDGNSLPFSKVQISNGDSPTMASTIVNIPENSMVLRLKISNTHSILINTGICAYLNLMKID